jgi:hypothetical protein
MRPRWLTRRRLWDGLLALAGLGVVVALLTLPAEPSHEGARAPTPETAEGPTEPLGPGPSDGPEDPVSESANAAALVLASAANLRLELGGAIERAQLVVDTAAEVHPSNVVDLAADVDEVQVWLGDRALGALPLRGAFVPARRPLELRFAVDGLDDQTVAFEQRGPVVYRLEVARELRRAHREEHRDEHRETGANPSESVPSPDEGTGTAAAGGDETTPQEPRRTDLRNPFR